jgi:hypothetical protein
LSWSVQGFPNNPYYALTGIWGPDANTLWVVGAQGEVVHWVGGSWNMPSYLPTGNTQSAVWGNSVSDIWMVDDASNLYNWDNNFNLGMNSPQVYKPTTFTGVWGTSPTNIWSVGYITNKGQIYHWDGNQNVLQTPGTGLAGNLDLTGVSLYGIWGTDTKNAWAVGSGSVLLQWNGSLWTVLNASQGQTTLNSVWATDPNQIWAAGSIGGVSGGIFQWNGTTKVWVQQPILHWNGAASAWVAADAGTVPTLYSISGFGTTQLVAVGVNEAILSLRP